MSVLARAVRERPAAQTDHDLVVACLAGDEGAWAQLIDRYKRLIYSVPLKYGVPQQDAGDLFQAVCLDLLSELPRLRDPQALPRWLIQVASHRAAKWKRQQQRYVANADTDQMAIPPEELPEAMLRELEREQGVRAALATLPPRCRRLMEMLFLETPARSYRDVAGQLGLAPGSIGFIRGRCLNRLRTELKRLGL
jgi:RNA polymerase sigma factor (sigma-70 family)